MRACSPRFATAAGVALTLALRAPWLGAPLGRDEGGVNMIASLWSPGHPFAYGPYFLDRPPLLVLLYRLAGNGAVDVRILGAVAAALGVVVCTALAAEVGGRRAALPAALIAGVLLSSRAIQSVYSPAELLAVVPSCASVLLVVHGLRSGRAAALAAAGALAIGALLIKQSFGDALVAGLAGIAVAAWRAPARASLARAGAYAAGVGAAVVALLAFDVIARLPEGGDGSLGYAIVGFRLDAVAPLAHGSLLGKLDGLGDKALSSGILVGLVAAVAGIVSLRRERVVALVLLAWLGSGVVGVTGGGSYWPHYLIELVPVLVVGTAVLAARRPLTGALACCAIAVLGAQMTVDDALHGEPEGYQRSAVAVGQDLRERAAPGDTAYILYAKVNALRDSGLRSPFPYEWSLMLEGVPGAQRQLRRLLASPGRPTWIVEWQGPRAFGLDRSGATARLLRTRYLPAGRVCGRPVLEALGSGPRPAVRSPACSAATRPGLDVDL